MPPQVLDQRAGQHDPLVGLKGQFGQRMHCLPVMAHGERLEAKHRLQLDQVLAPGLFPLTIVAPGLDRHLELISDQFQQRRGRRLIDAQNDAGETQVTELYREAQTVSRPAPLPDDREVGIAERVMSDQVVLGVRQRQ